jgi:N-acetylglutamate synthase-like GNAT family acetyltransferase
MPEWVRETPARWDADKERVLGGIPPEIFGLGSPGRGDALADEWWRVEDDGRVVGYGRLDDTWGDAEILVLVDPERRKAGIGAFILQRLEQEASARSLNYIYNVVPTGHPDPETVTRWLTGCGFEATEVGELRKRVPKADPR